MPDFIEIPAHSSPVSALEISHDNNYLFSGAEDGTLFVFKINDLQKEKNIELDANKKNANLSKDDDKKKIAQALNDFFLVKTNKITQKNELIKKLQFEVKRSEQKVKLDADKQEHAYQKKIEQINADFENNLIADKQIQEAMEIKSQETFSELKEEYEKQRIAYEIEIENIKRIQQEKVEYEEERNNELEIEIEEKKYKHKEELVKLLNNHKDDLKNLKEKYTVKCEKVQEKLGNLTDKAKNFCQYYIQNLDKIENSYEMDLDEKVRELKEEIEKLKKQNEQLQQLNYARLKQYENLNEKDHELQKKMNDLLDANNTIRHDNIKNDADIIKIQHQFYERMQVISSKEETLKNARDEQINLQNFKYMLDQKIKELQITKNETLVKIEEKEKKLKNMFNELIKESTLNEQKFQTLRKRNGETELLSNNIKKLELELFLSSNVLKSFQTHLLKIMQNPERIPILANLLREMLEKSKEQSNASKIPSKRHITGEDVNEIVKVSNEKGQDINDELVKQSKWMTKKLWLIQETCKKLKKIRDESINQILNQNTKLIEECNLLRSENERQKKVLKNAEKQLAEAIRKKNKMLKIGKPTDNSTTQLQSLVQKYEDSKEQLKHQQVQLSTLKESMNEILLKSDSEEEPTKLPSISKNFSQASYSYEHSHSTMLRGKSSNPLIKIKENPVKKKKKKL